MIGLSAQTYDPDGTVILALRPEAKNEMRRGGRRQTRTATLDGGVSLYDTGTDVSDRVWPVRAAATEAAKAAIEYLCETYQRLYAATEEGFYDVTIPEWRLEDADIVVSIALLEELS